MVGTHHCNVGLAIFRHRNPDHFRRRRAEKAGRGNGAVVQGDDERLFGLDAVTQTSLPISAVNLSQDTVLTRLHKSLNHIGDLG